MRTTSTINFYCRSAKTDKHGYAPISVVIIINGERFAYNTPRKAIPDAFKKDMGSRKGNDTKDYCNAIRTNTERAITDILSHGLPLTASTLKEYIQTGGIKTYTVTDLFDEYLGILEKRIGIDLTEGAFKKYQTVKTSFLSFLGHDAELSSVNVGTVRSYYATLNQSYATSSSAGMLTKLRTVIKYALATGRLQNDPFATIHVNKGKPVIAYLTKDQLKTLVDRRFDNERLENVRKLAVLQASTGLAYCDLALLTPEDIRECNGHHYIQKNRVKTGLEYTAMILPEGLEIVKQGLPKILSNQKYNSYLKEIGDICGIPSLTTHVFRKTYATRLLNAGVDMAVVQKSLGHQVGSKVTATYYVKYETDTVIDSVSKALEV